MLQDKPDLTPEARRVLQAERVNGDILARNNESAEV